MKNERGITLAALMIMIVVITILAGVSITAGISASTDMKDKNMKSELQMVQHAILEQYQKYRVTNDTSALKGDSISKTEVDKLLPKEATKPTKADGYYRLDPTDLNEIGIKRTKDSYIVNYETGMTYNETAKATSEGEALYLTEINKAI